MEEKSLKEFMETDKVNAADPAPTYDPNKGYRWDPEAKFLIEGNEFGLIINAIKAKLASPEAQIIMMLQKAHQAMENSLARAVQVGLAVEVEDKKKSSK
jgi:hypothetical protein